MLYGGGITDGQVVGKSSRDGGEPIDNRLTPDNLLATIFHTLFDFSQARLLSGVPDRVLKDLAAIEKIRRVI